MIRITIILCTYNGEEFIKDQLKSLERQTFKPEKILIYDSNSKDKTKRIIEDFIRNSKILTKLYELPFSGSVAKSFKSAITHSYKNNLLGDYIALCDQDDLWKLNKLEIFKNTIEKFPKEKPICFFSDVELIDKYSALINKSRYSSSLFFNQPNNINNAILFANPCTGMSMIFSLDIARDYSLFNYKDVFLHDWTILLLSYFGNYDIVISNEQLVSYRQHNNNVLGTNSKRNLLQNLFYIPKFMKKTFTQFKNVRTFYKNNIKMRYFSIKLIFDILMADFISFKYSLVIISSYVIFYFFIITLNFRNLVFK